MTAVLFVATALVIALACLILWVTRTWRLAALAGFILALLAIVAEAPRAATELWGQTVPGLIAATQETLRLESVRASGARSSHYNPKHRFGAIVCYRLPGNPGLGAGAPLDPAIQAAIGEPPSEADRTCRQTPRPGHPAPNRNPPGRCGCRCREKGGRARAAGGRRAARPIRAGPGAGARAG